jgi:formylglycine-generating enzyme required for sulfatase activity
MAYIRLTRRKILPAIISVVIPLLLWSVQVFASPDDYHPITGEPKCMNCHTPDRRYSIDYTRGETCFDCHGAGLSERYIEIDSRFKVKIEDTNSELKTQSSKLAKNSKNKPSNKSNAKAPKDMVIVPAGEFTMGSNDWWPKSQPEHRRHVDAFYIDKYEVINLRYKSFVDATGHRLPGHWVGGNIPKGRGDHPVIFVDWFDADAFCRWEGKRLPREEEWEKAARGTDKRAFPWGDKFYNNKANTPQYGHEDAMPVGSFEDGRSPYGVYDMAGNVWEWTDGWFKPYPGNTHPDENYGERYKVTRGGSWYDCTYYKCGISAPAYNRIFFDSKTKNNNFGFRCAKDG